MKKSDVKKLLRMQKVVKLKPEKPTFQFDISEIKNATNSEYQILREMHKQLGDHVNERVDSLEDDVKRAFKSAAKEQHEEQRGTQQDIWPGLKTGRWGVGLEI